MFRTGQAERTYRSEWDKAIKSTGGLSILQDEEGINNIPLTIKRDRHGKIVDLCEEKVLLKHELDPEIIQRTSQISWSPMHKIT